MRTQFQHGRLVIRTDFAPTKFGIRHVTLVAPGVAEMHAGMWCMIQFIPRNIFSHQITAIVGEPQLAAVRVKCQANTVPYAFSINFLTTAVC